MDNWTELKLDWLHICIKIPQLNCVETFRLIKTLLVRWKYESFISSTLHVSIHFDFLIKNMLPWQQNICVFLALEIRYVIVCVSFLVYFFVQIKLSLLRCWRVSNPLLPSQMNKAVSASPSALLCPRHGVEFQRGTRFLRQSRTRFLSAPKIEIARTLSGKVRGAGGRFGEYLVVLCVNLLLC